MATKYDLNAESIADAVNLANDFRAVFGGETIDDLPSGIPSESRHCVLAKAFNFDCEVDGSGGSEGDWYVKFKTIRVNSAKVKAEKLAEILETDVKVNEYTSWDGTEQATYTVFLPDYIAAIAIAFDADELERKYYADIDGELDEEYYGV